MCFRPREGREHIAYTIILSQSAPKRQAEKFFQKIFRLPLFLPDGKELDTEG